MIGKIFGSWSVIGGPKQDKARRKLWLCECECGGKHLVYDYALRHNLSSRCTSCATRISATQHGDSGARLYISWKGMRTRCNNQKDIHYKDYGGRGIIVCSEWDDYINFKRWAIENGYKNNLEIDRKDNDGIYEPKNCHWTTSKINCRNKRNNHFLTAFGERKCISAWAEDLRCSISRAGLLKRIKKGYLPEVAISTPVFKINSIPLLV